MDANAKYFQGEVEDLLNMLDQKQIKDMRREDNAVIVATNDGKLLMLTHKEGKCWFHIVHSSP